MPEPHLRILQGSKKGERHLLQPTKTVLGRGRDCHILLKSTKKAESISRKHAIITREQDRYYIEDGDGAGTQSHNDTIVNDVRLPGFPGRTLLKNNDVIRICEYALRFCDGSDSHGSDSSLSSITASVGNDSSVYLAQPAEKLQLLLEISNRHTHSLDLDRLLPLVVKDLLDLFRQAQRGFLIFVDSATGALSTQVVRARQPQDEKNACFSTSIVQQSLASGQGLLYKDSPGAPPDGSIVGLAIQSAMCAPLWIADERPFGVLLVDSTNAKKKFTKQDLKLLMAVAGQASIALANARYHRNALARERIDRDLELARAVQRSFLPERLPEIAGYDFFACNESALAVGGDYYDFIELPGQRLAILLGDVAGKGVAAALVMTRFSGEVRTALLMESNLATAIGVLNARLQNLSRTDRFVTLAALVLDAAAHTVTIVNAGHPSPLVVRRATGTVEDASPRDAVGPPIGVFDGIAYRTRQVHLEPGDHLLLFSDGVTEAMDADDRQFTIVRLRALLQGAKEGPAELGKRVLDAVKQHATGCEQHDDITLVCVGRGEAGK